MKQVITRICLGAIGLLFTLDLAAAGEYTIQSRADWEKWSYPGGGVVEITPGGLVQLISIEKDINACLNAPNFTYRWSGTQYTGGIRGAGSRSNSADAPKVIDGDSTTFWAPDPDDPVESWVIEIDLGRLVSAKKIRLKFAEGKRPFSEFKIYTSEGLPKYFGSRLKLLDYALVFQSVKDNTEQIFELELAPDIDHHGNPLIARYLQYVKIFFTKEVEDAGLAEVEVITLGKNIALDTIARKGWIKAGSATPPTSNIFDGTVLEYWNCPLGGADWQAKGGWFLWDLGAVFWIDTVRMNSRYVLLSNYPTFFEGFRIYLSDGTLALRSPSSVWRPDGKDVAWEMVADINNTRVLPPLLDFDFQFSPSKRVRYIFLHHYYGAGYYGTRVGEGARLFEMQLFGEGRIPGATLVSPLIDVGKAVNLTAVSWDADTPPGTRIEVRTRTGERVVETTHYYNKMGNEVTKEYWDRTPHQQGHTAITMSADEKYWSPWSSAYLRSGEKFLSPSPRRYLEIEASLLSENPNEAPSLNALTLSHSPPALGSIFSEITPKVARSGVPQTFSLKLRMPPRGTIIWYNRFNREVTEVAWNQLSQLLKGRVVEKIERFYDNQDNEITGAEWLSLDPALRGAHEEVEEEMTGLSSVLITTPSPAGKTELEIGGQKTEPESVEATDDSLVVTLLRTVFTEKDSLEIQFECIPFLNSTLFEVWISGPGAAWQGVDPDPAVKNATTVSLPALAREERLISNLEITPRTFSPNDDGVNDILEISFTLVKVAQARQVKVKIFELGGNLVKTLYSELGTTANYSGITWGGEDSSDQLVAPGLYLCVITVSSDAGDNTVSKTISVAY